MEQKVRITCVQVAFYKPDPSDYSGNLIVDRPTIEEMLRADIAGLETHGFDMYDISSDEDLTTEFKYELVTLDDEGKEIDAVEYDEAGNPKTPRGVGAVTDIEDYD